MKRNKKQKGITLIALVITIVILLILAAVTLSPVIDERLFKHAENAINEFENLQSNDNDWLDNYKENLISKPKEFQTLEYLESTGTQWIDTGYNFTTNNIKIEMKFIPINPSAHYCLFGLDENGYIINAAGIGTNLGIYVGTSGDVYRHTILSNEENTLTSYTKDGIVYTDLNGTTKSASYSGNFIKDSTTTIFVEKKASSNTVSYYSTMRLFYFKMYEEDVLVRNFIPCYRKSDNVAGMYDTVNNVFYTNQGTGEFVRGPEVTQ